MIAESLGKDVVAENAAIEDDALTRAEEMDARLGVLIISQLVKLDLKFRRSGWEDGEGKLLSKPQ